MLSRLTLALVLMAGLVLTACQNQEHASPTGPAHLKLADDPADDPDPNDPQTIEDALAACIKDPGLANAAVVRWGNAVEKKNSGDLDTAQNMIGELINFLYARNDEGQWTCSTEYLAKLIVAMALYAGLPVPDVEIVEETLDGGGGGICFGAEGCKFLTEDGCAGIEIPIQNDPQILFVSVFKITENPFLGVYRGYNSFPDWADVDIEGDIENLDPPATVAVWTVEPPDLAAPIPAVAARLRLGHVFFNELTGRDEVEFLPLPDHSILACNQSTVQTGWKGWLASLFRPTNLIANPGETGGKLSPFGSPIGGADPASDTQTGIEPNNTALNDQQSVTLTATVTAVPSPVTGNTDPLDAGDPLEFLVNGAVWSQTTIDATGQATLQLKCGVDIGAGTHTVDAHYLSTDTHAESSTTDDDSPTGSATVVCTTAFTPINFDRGPDGKPLKNGEIVNTVYQSLGVTFSRHRNNANQTLCGIGNDVYAVTDPATGNFGSPPRVVSLCASGDTRISAGSGKHGWIRATFFSSAKSQVCVDVFPATQGNRGVLRAFDAVEGGAQIGSDVSGQGTSLCVAGTGIRRVEFSGDPSGSKQAKFDTMRVQ